MNKTLKQAMVFFMAFVICLSTVSNSVYAREILKPSDLVEVKVSEDGDILKTNNVGTAVVKKAIRLALRNSDNLVRSASKWIGKDVAKVVEKNFVKATPVLKTLLKYDDLVWKTVQDQLTHVVGRQAAVWIRMALECLL